MPRTKSNNNENKGSGKAPEFAKLETYEIKRAREVSYNGKTSVLADVTLNGVTVYGVKAVTYTDREGKERDFIGWPERKGSDDKYYKIAYCPLSNDDQQKICDAIYAKLDE